MEARVVEKINQSKNLAELEKILADAEKGFGIADDSTYESARQEIDSYVKSGQYSAVVGKKDVYESLIKNMGQQNQNMATAVNESQQRIEKIINVKQGPEAQTKIGKRLHEIVD